MYEQADMITSVHSQGRVIDLWTGEAFDSAVRFKIPVLDGKKWKGCYATPSTALAALKVHISENLKDKPDHQAMLEDLFQSSLRRKPDADPRTNSFVIQAAPHFSELVEFGGSVTLDAFHEKYNHALQRRLFTQVIPTQAQPDDEGAETGEEAAAAAAAAAGEAHSRPWYVREVAAGAAAADGESGTQALPRCVKSWIDFLREHASQQDAVVVYFSKKDKYCFALGSPTHYFKKSNSRVSSYFDAPVYGAVTVFKHAPIKLASEEKRKRKEEEDAEAAPAHKARKSNPQAAAKDKNGALEEQD